MAGQDDPTATLAERLRRMAEASRTETQVATDGREARDAVIVEADAAGWTLGQIAKPTGMSRSLIHHVLVTAARKSCG